MKELLASLFTSWWRPILFFGISVILYIAGILYPMRFFSDVAWVLFLAGLLGLISSTLFLLFTRQWLKGLLTGLLFCSTIAVWVIWALTNFILATVEGDKWADNLTIPGNIAIAEPVDLPPDYKRPDSFLTQVKTKPDLQLYNSFQPGLYEYDFHVGRIERGAVYLKAYEITQNHPLSPKSLQERSTLAIFNPSDSIITVGTSSCFTIYEGDWGKPYAARFEVWFRPENKGAEQKLFEKIYKIEGWQR